MNTGRSSKAKLLAVASGGGHWEQLMLIRPALEEFDVEFATTVAALATREGLDHVLLLPDTNRSRPLRAIACMWRAWRIVRGVRPDFVMTTGALPGLFCLIAGRFSGATTIWIDSVANSERMSMSGRFASRFASLSLTQWEHLSRPPNPIYAGELL